MKGGERISKYTHEGSDKVVVGREAVDRDGGHASRSDGCKKKAQGRMSEGASVMDEARSKTHRSRCQ